MENILTTHDYEKGEFASSQSGGYGLVLKSTKPYSKHKWKISHFTTYHRSIVVCITTRIDKSLIFWENFKLKSQSGKNGLNEIG